jgi:hypothetical protein
MPVIRVSQQTWDRLKEHATPLEHSANDIVSMALDALDQIKWKPTGVGAVSSPELQPKKADQRRTRRYSPKELRLFLLETLYGLGGDATTREIRESARRILTPTLAEIDCELVANGIPRWWNAICTVRSDLIAEGLLGGDSERGIWELSKKGREFLSARAGHVTQLRRRDGGSMRPEDSAGVRKSPKHASNTGRHRRSRS